MYLLWCCRVGLANSIGLQWRNPGKGGQRTADLVPLSINQLSEAVYEDIVRLYHTDFAIFGYQPMDWRDVRRRIERSRLR